MDGLMRNVAQREGRGSDYCDAVDEAAGVLADEIAEAPCAGLPDWLCDPLTRALMAADGVTPAALGALLREIAAKLGFRRQTRSRTGFLDVR
jgi:hypothetical protein